jgi:2-C-methyl-D-erythritol 4-phosphate cytidylyltransferase/2-C-methyl-D-erythritol 2,4-cyclodiphosphate synthase
MRVGVIIVAGGRGLRLGGEIPKQLLEIGGRSVLRRAVDIFDAHPRIDQIVVVLPDDLVAEAARLIGPTGRPCAVAVGGPTRQESVRRGLAALPPGPDVVLIHDAARPFAPADLIDRVIDEAVASGAAVPAVAVTETVKRLGRDGRHVRETIAREEIWLAQTPQGFRRAVLEAAFARVGDPAAAATDDAMLVEQAGHPVRLVPGDVRNVKITTMSDLDGARARHRGAPRVGTGYDLHRLVDGRPLRLAGVELDAVRGPLGHSDGDVVCHAVIDAIFGAAAMGDIGHHFPNTDPRWQDAAGLDLLEQALAIVATAGWRVSSVDVTVVLERPKLAPHTSAVVAALAQTLALPSGCVSVKAKTNEGVDAVGRGEAIAAHAVVVLTGTVDQ